jgi:NAD(P)H-hydrate epimerase
MREADKLTTVECGVPSILLMESASAAVARAIEERLDGGISGLRAAVFCGRGNNGGDGAAVARHLWQRGAYVRVFLFGSIEKTKGDARENFSIAKKLVGKESGEGGQLEFAEIEDAGNLIDAIKGELGSFDVLVDAMFGTGLSRPVEGDLAAVCEMLRRSDDPESPSVVSVDIPSGLDADKSEPIGPHVESDLTVTFTAPKPANVLPPASQFNGEVVIAGIGTPDKVVSKSGSKLYVSEDADAKEWLRKTAFTDSSYKKTRGTLLIVAGSSRYTGAAVLAANAASETGVGMVTLASPRSATGPIGERVIPEVITTAIPETDSGNASEEAFEIVANAAKGVDAVAIGCGLGSDDESTKELVRRLIADLNVPVVIDADGLNSIAPMSVKGTEQRPLILTPHQGEFLRLLGTEDRSVLDDRVAAIRRFAVENSVILVLKGERTLVASPKGIVVIVSTGNSGLGKAGNGDNLTGIIAGCVAQAQKIGADLFETVVASVHLSGLAGDFARGEFGRRSMLASDVRRSFAAAVRFVEGDSE